MTPTPPPPPLTIRDIVQGIYHPATRDAATAPHPGLADPPHEPAAVRWWCEDAGAFHVRHLHMLGYRACRVRPIGQGGAGFGITWAAEASALADPSARRHRSAMLYSPHDMAAVLSRACRQLSHKVAKLWQTGRSDKLHALAIPTPDRPWIIYCPPIPADGKDYLRQFERESFNAALIAEEARTANAENRPPSPWEDVTESIIEIHAPFPLLIAAAWSIPPDSPALKPRATQVDMLRALALAYEDIAPKMAPRIFGWPWCPGATLENRPAGFPIRPTPSTPTPESPTP